MLRTGSASIWPMMHALYRLIARSIPAQSCDASPIAAIFKLFPACLKALSQEWPTSHLARTLVHPQRIVDVCSNCRFQKLGIVYHDRLPQTTAVIVLDAGAFRRADRTIFLCHALSGKPCKVDCFIRAIGLPYQVRVQICEHRV